MHILWLVLLVLLPSISVTADHFSPYDEQRLVFIFAVGMMLLFSHRQLATPAPGLLFLSFALLGLLSVAFSMTPSYASLEWSLWICLISFVVLLSRQLGDEVTICRLVLPLIAVGMLLYGIVSLSTLFIAWHYEGAPFWPALIHRFANVRFFNQYQSWLLPLLPALLYSTVVMIRPGLLKTLLVLYSIFFFSLLFYSGGRGTMVGLLAAGIVVLILFRRPGMRWSAIMIGYLSMGLLLAYHVFPQSSMAGVSSRIISQAMSNDASVLLSKRDVLWQQSLGMVEEQPWLGSGPMGFAAIGSSIAAHPHNFPLQLAAEWGLPATLALFSALGYALLTWLVFAYRRVKDPQCPPWEKTYIISLSASLITAGVHSLVSGIVVMPISQAMLVLVSSMALGWYMRYQQAPSQPTRLLLLWRPLAIAAAIWLMAMTTHQVIYFDEIMKHAELSQPGYQPRFWSRGHLHHHVVE